MRRHFGDLGAVISKRKTTQYSYSYAHPEIVDPVPEARRASEGGGGGWGGLLSLCSKTPPPSPPHPPEFINNKKSL